jgi:serine/threonine protein kinase
MISRYCERCGRSTQDGNLWCQDRDCPAEAGYSVFRYGDYLGDMKITRQVTVWRTATLYEAERDGRPVWVKVAHTAPECEERLKEEAQFLRKLFPHSGDKPSFLQSFRPTARQVLPQLLPPYPTPSNRPYGELSVAGTPRVFSVFTPLSGVVLRDLLLEMPQVWHYEAAWMISTLASALHALSGRNTMHLSLTPDIIMVDKDAAGHFRPALVDLGWLADTNVSVGRFAEIINRSEPVYTAPEVSAAKNASALMPAADAYSLGMIYFEMLKGKPGYEPVLQHDDQVRQAVIQNRAPLQVERPELASAGVVEIVEKAISPRVRFGSVDHLRQALDKIYGKPPPEKRPVPMRFYMLVGVIGAILFAIIILALLVALQASRAPLG